MKKTHLLPSLLLILLASCQYHGLRLGLTEDEIKTTSLEDLLTAEGLDEAKAKEAMGKSEGYLLIHAAREGWLSVVHKLLLQGVDVDSKDTWGYTPLHRAAINGHTAIVKLLLEKDATVDSKDHQGTTPLHQAAFGGHTAIVKLLLEKGAAVDSKDESGSPPLHWAAINGHTEMVKLLLEKGAAVNSKDNLGSTPLHTAARYGHTGVASLLLCHEADLTITNNRGRTALQGAQSMKKPETSAFLRLAASKSKAWLEAYAEGFTYKKKHTWDEEKVHTYARVYAELCEEDPDYAFTAMPYYFKYLEEDKMSHEDAKANAIGMAHVL